MYKSLYFQAVVAVSLVVVDLIISLIILLC